MERKYLENLEERFLRYVKIDTQSDESSDAAPSTEKQYDLLRPLQRELKALGASDVTLTENGYVLATVPATVEVAGPTVAFLAHVDTAPAFGGTRVKPLVHRDYDGESVIVLPEDPDRRLSPEELPELAKKKGHDVITASGDTLLGADDKAGVAIIMTLAEYLLDHPAIPHGDVRICFTPDEEIGRGVEGIELEEIAADVGYTLDGGTVGEITYENFSADKAVVRVKGIPAHPGKAKGQMVNAMHLAARFITMLPRATHSPETTEEYEGFIHLYKMSGTTAEAELYLILRDFEMEGLEGHRRTVRAIAEALRAVEPRAKVEVEVEKQYRNMYYWLEDDMGPAELALEATRAARLEPERAPIRGGTDGARLTERGLPTPNLFTGMQNVHGPLEWITVQDMAKATEVCVNLARLWAERS
jgi:tripeptide aminopeptidase